MAWRTRATIKNNYVWKPASYQRDESMDIYEDWLIEYRAKARKRWNIVLDVACNDWNHISLVHSWNCCVTPYILISRCCSLLERAAAIEPTLSRITFYLICRLSATPRAVTDIARQFTTNEIVALLFVLSRESQILFLQIYAHPFQRVSTCICNSIARNCVVQRTISHSFFLLVIQNHDNAIVTIRLFLRRFFTRST